MRNRFKRSDMKMLFLESRPKLLQFIVSRKIDMGRIISIEQNGFLFTLKGLQLKYLIQTDSDYTFFTSNLIINEIGCEAS